MYIVDSDSFHQSKHGDYIANVDEIVATLLTHFDNRYKKSTRGVVTLVVGVFDGSPRIIAGIGRTPFLYLNISNL